MLEVKKLSSINTVSSLNDQYTSLALPPLQVLFTMEYREKPEDITDQTSQGAQSGPSTSQPMAESSSSRSSNDLKKPKKKKKKVEMACVYCRRSHMICDDSRPCLRCIKRGIGHLCHDEPTPGRQRKKGTNSGTSTNPTPPTSTNSVPDIHNTTKALPEPSGPQPDLAGYLAGSNRPEPGSLFVQPGQPLLLAQQVGRAGNGGQFLGSVAQGGIGGVGGGTVGSLLKNLPFNEEPFFYSEHAGSEFSSLNDFLSMIDDPELVNGSLGGNNNGNNADSLMAFLMPQSGTSSNVNNLLSFSPSNMQQPTFDQSNDPNVNLNPEQTQTQTQTQPQGATNGANYDNNTLQVGNKVNDNQQQQQQQPVISDSARDKFFLTAADPTTEISPEERLKQVIKAKLEAGLLQPYNYAKGYARLQSYMDNYMNQSSRQRILKPLSIFRPAFRAIARTLKDVDLVLVEESFERMLLDYDRVFTSMAIPACLWRRTGEIYRGNKEFASLVGVTTDDLKDGKLAIYELMSEESAVNFWEKYGAIAFDKGQKAVLTSCNLRTRDGFKRKSCCFSFTIRRDRYNIPSCIVGNFIPIDP